MSEMSDVPDEPPPPVEAGEGDAPDPPEGPSEPPVIAETGSEGAAASSDDAPDPPEASAEGAEASAEGADASEMPEAEEGDANAGDANAGDANAGDADAGDAGAPDPPEDGLATEAGAAEGSETGGDSSEAPDPPEDSEAQLPEPPDSEPASREAPSDFALGSHQERAEPDGGEGAESVDGEAPDPPDTLEQPDPPGDRADEEGPVESELTSQREPRDTQETLDRIDQARDDPTVGPLLDGYEPYGDLTPEEFNDKYWDPEADNGKGGWSYPENDGAVPGTEVETVLEPGTKIDRFGPDTGRYLSPDGTPLEERSLPPESVGLPGSDDGYHQYEVLRPLPAMAGECAPGFEQPGGGLQYKTNQSIGSLCEGDDPYLREVFE